MSDQTLFTEVQFLAAYTQTKPAAFDAAGLHVGLAQIESVFIWWSVGLDWVPSEEFGILALNLKL
jgi:hypothetical protein